MPVDTSIYPAPQAPVNPLTQMTNAVGLIGGMNQNKQFQQEFAARQAIGPIYQQSINPLTGELNTNKLLYLSSQNPAVAWKAGEIAKQAQDREFQQTQIDKTKFDLAVGHNKAMNEALTGLMSNPNASPADGLRVLSDAVKDGRVTPEQAAGIAARMPTDPAQFRGPFLQELFVQNMDVAQKLQALYGQIYPTDTGSGTNFVAASPMTGARTLGTVEKGLTPGQKAETLTIFNPATQREEIITKGQLLAGGAPAGIAAGPALGAQVAAETTAEGAAKNLNSLYSEVSSSGSRIFQLSKALSALEKTTTGPGTGSRNDVLSFLDAAPGFKALVPGYVREDVKNYDEANKYLQQYAMSQATNLGAGTDEKLSTALSANASTKISNLAAREVVKANIGLEKYKQAMVTAFDNSGNPPENFNKWSKEWAKTADPRAFVWNMMSEADRKAAMSKMSQQEKQNLVQTIKWAEQNGLFGH